MEPYFWIRTLRSPLGAKSRAKSENEWRETDQPYQTYKGAIGLESNDVDVWFPGEDVAVYPEQSRHPFLPSQTESLSSSRVALYSGSLGHSAFDCVCRQRRRSVGLQMIWLKPLSSFGAYRGQGSPSEFIPKFEIVGLNLLRFRHSTSGSNSGNVKYFLVMMM